jgi:Domain of unknown function (DUF4349)
MKKIPLVLVVGGLAGMGLLGAPLLGGCASARSHGPVTGAFNGDDGASGYAESAPSSPSSDYDAAPAALAMDEAEASGSRGFFGGAPGRADMAKEAPMAPPPPPRPAPAPSDSSAAEGKPVEVQPEASTGAEPSVPVPSARIMIYTGTATVLVPAVTEAQQKLTARVEALGGYVQSAQGDTSSNHATITYRIPVAKFFELKAELPSYGQVLNDAVQAEDITKQLFDLEIRLDSATKSRDRLVELLKQAQKMEEILQIEGEIRRLTDEIEALKGQLRFLKDRAAFSTLTVQLYSNAPPPVTGPRRTYSRFNWINQVGPEKVLNEF